MGKDKDKDRDSDSSDNDGLKSEADREADWQVLEEDKDYKTSVPTGTLFPMGPGQKKCTV
jgi:hypothetical protein